MMKRTWVTPHNNDSKLEKYANLEQEALKQRQSTYNIIVTYLMMRYATHDPNSLQTIAKIVSEESTEIKITAQNLILFWVENLQPHLDKCISLMSPMHISIITQLYLHYGADFWTKLDFQKCNLFLYFDDLTILYVILLQQKLACFSMYGTFSQMIFRPQEHVLLRFYVQKQTMCNSNKNKLAKWFEELQKKEH